MKRANWFLLGILISFILLSFGCVTVGVAADWTMEQKEIIALAETWQRAFDNKDLQTLDRLLAQDEIYLDFIVLKATFRDKTLFLEAARKYFAENRMSPDGTISVYITYPNVNISGGEASLIKIIEVTKTGGRQPWYGTFKKEIRFRKINGEWRVFSEKNL